MKSLMIVNTSNFFRIQSLTYVATLKAVNMTYKDAKVIKNKISKAYHFSILLY